MTSATGSNVALLVAGLAFVGVLSWQAGAVLKAHSPARDSENAKFSGLTKLGLLLCALGVHAGMVMLEIACNHLNLPSAPWTPLRMTLTNIGFVPMYVGVIIFIRRLEGTRDYQITWRDLRDTGLLAAGLVILALS